MKFNDLNDTVQYLTNLKYNSFELLFILHKFIDKLQFDHIKYLNYLTNYLISSFTYNLNLNLIEEQANDISYIQLLFDKSIDNKIQSLLNYLPLLNKSSNNDINELKRIYIKLLESIFDNDRNNLSNTQLKELEKLVLLFNIHPIFDKQEQDNFIEKFKSIQTSFSSNNNTAIIPNFTINNNCSSKSKLALSRNPSVLPNYTNNLSTHISSSNSSTFLNESDLFQSQKYSNNRLDSNHLRLNETRSQPNPSSQNRINFTRKLFA